MLKSILIWLAVFIALSLLILWIISGGIGRIIDSVRGVASQSEQTEPGTLRLPWQPADLSYGPNMAELLNYESGGAGSPSQDIEEELAALGEEYESLEEAAREARDFGTPSPYRDDVQIAQDAAIADSIENEYVTLTAAWDNTTPIDITGWSLQSALTGVRAYIPRGAQNFYMGIVNEQRNIQLNPGDSATAHSGYSPVGTSLRENICSGYLNQFQTFVPRFSEECPASAESLPLTAENLQLYGDACIDFVRTLPACFAPLESFTPELSFSCRGYLANTLSYNGCVERYRHRANFIEGSWRIYLSSTRELWRNSHDVIRLLDKEGRTVDAITY